MDVKSLAKDTLPLTQHAATIIVRLTINVVAFFCALLLGLLGGRATAQNELRNTLKNGKVVIALGRQGLKAAAMLDPAQGVVVGGVGTAPDAERLNGISLAPDPALLFGMLKTLLPGIRRVIVVYNPASNEAQIRLAREAARGLGLE